MAPEKSPVLLINPVEMLTDGRIRVLTCEQLGFYITLVSSCVCCEVEPDLQSIAAVCKVSRRSAARLWPSVEKLFLLKRGRLWPLSWSGLHVGVKGTGPISRLLRILKAFWGDACVYCGENRSPLEIEHIVPKARGGGNELTNLTVACQQCNNAKGTRTAEEFGFPHIHEQAKGIQ